MTDSRDFLRAVFSTHVDLAERVATDLAEEILAGAEAVATALRRGGKVLACGNGGSAADAQHFTAELVGRFGGAGEPLAAIALTVDTSVLTALGNDQGFDRVFVRQVEALGRPGDVLVAITTSGRSENVLRAVTRAKQRGLTVIGLSGSGGREAFSDVDVAICVPSEDTQRIQEMHSVILHSLGEIAVRQAE